MRRGSFVATYALALATMSCSTQVLDVHDKGGAHVHGPVDDQVNDTQRAREQSDAASKPSTTRADCSGCHEREYTAASEHVGIKPAHCATCHSETAWTPTQLNHRWPLNGPHAKTACIGCHKGPAPDYEQTATTCSSCHQQASARVAAPVPAPALKPPEPLQPEAGHPAPERAAPPPPPSAASTTPPMPQAPPGTNSSAPNTLEQTALRRKTPPTPLAAKISRPKPERRQHKRQTLKSQAVGSSPQPGTAAEPQPAGAATPPKNQPRDKQTSPPMSATSAAISGAPATRPKRAPALAPLH